MDKVEAYTVQELINQLQTYEKPDEKIIFQYMTAGHAGISEKLFSEIAAYLMENEQLGEDTANVFLAWIEEANGVLIMDKKGA
jgi:hypothetical protein